MSFIFNWNSFNEHFYSGLKFSLNESLNELPKPSNIVSPLEVSDLYMGTESPKLEILEISELSKSAIKGFFYLSYSGNGYLVLQTNVQANPVSSNKVDIDPIHQKGILAANKPLIVPMKIRITDIQLKGYIRISWKKEENVSSDNSSPNDNAVHLSFINDPLYNVNVSSNFDSLPKLKIFLQNEIERSIRSALMDDLPEIIYRCSLCSFHNPNSRNVLGNESRKSSIINAKIINRHDSLIDKNTLSYYSIFSSSYSPYQSTLLQSLSSPFSFYLLNSKNLDNVSQNGKDQMLHDDFDIFKAIDTHLEPITEDMIESTINNSEDVQISGRPKETEEADSSYKLLKKGSNIWSSFLSTSSGYNSKEFSTSGQNYNGPVTGNESKATLDEHFINSATENIIILQQPSEADSTSRMQRSQSYSITLSSLHNNSAGNGILEYNSNAALEETLSMTRRSSLSLFLTGTFQKGPQSWWPASERIWEDSSQWLDSQNSKLLIKREENKKLSDVNSNIIASYRTNEHMISIYKKRGFNIPNKD